MELNKKIAKCIEERGIKQNHIASCLGVKANTVSQILLGHRKISAIEFMTLCSALDVDPREFFPELYGGIGSQKGAAS